MSSLAGSVSLAIAAVRLRSDEANDPAVVRRVLDLAAIHLASALGDDTHAPLAEARKALSIGPDPIAEAAYRITFAVAAARCVRIDTETVATDLACVAHALAKASVAA